ncbi:MAG: hypothetical protein WA910_00885, partial [Sphingopyxis granuli]
AKAGVQMAQRYHAWTPAFAGEQLPTCLKDIYPDLIRVTMKAKSRSCFLVTAGFNARYSSPYPGVPSIAA